jgi:hypothetical protein
MTNNATAQVFQSPIRLFLVLTTTALPALAGPDHAARAPAPAAPAATAEAYHQPFEQAMVPPSTWNDSGKQLPQVDFDLPISEVVSQLKRQFSNEFDVILIYNNQDGTDWNSSTVRLQLRNVTATEIFNAMNLAFASAKTPLHWDLMMNGSRSTAVLRVIETPKPPEPPPAPPPPQQVTVFFVGTLLGDSKSPGMTMDQLLDTVTRVCHDAIGDGHVSGYKEAQLIIGRGTDSDIIFMKSMLDALQQKVQWDARSANAAVEIDPATGLPKAPPPKAKSP